MITCHTVHGRDAAALADLLKDAEEDQDRLEKALLDPASTVYRLDDGATAIGAAVVAWRETHHELRYIAVVEGRRGEGHGRALIERIVRELEDTGGTLEVGTGNSSLDNIAFYQRVGFRMAVIRRDYFAYVDPGVEEFGIPLRDMVVFDRAATRPPTDARTPAAGGGVRLALIPGSTRPDSTNTAALRTLRDLFPDADLFEGLADIPPLVPGATDGHVVADLRARLAAADLVVISTPEYAGSLPGSLKNLLDWTVGGADLHRKPVVWLNVAAPGRGEGASSDLAKVLGYVDAQVLRPGGIRIPVPRGAVGPSGLVEDEPFRAALVRELVPVLEEVERAER
jgi:chromate reductase, NAD(P)H dehydrogenase (quinone)